MTPEVSQRIEERRLWLDAAMEAVIASCSPDLELYQWSRYHLGWRDEQLGDVPEPERAKYGGKRLRGILAMLACEALGGNGQRSAPAGAAVELIHNFSLVHDDVEDNDAERRHRPTVWKLWGVPHAINVGSNMQALVDAALLQLADRYPAEAVVRSFRVVTQAILLMTEGQYLDMAAQDAAEMSLESYFRMTGGKTAALLQASLEIGAGLACDDPARVAALAEFGRRFGLAFQCRDDYLGMWGDPARTGKPVASDLIQGKRSLPVVHALAALPAGSARGQDLRVALTARDVDTALALFEELGTPQFVAQRVQEHTDAALSALEQAQAAGPSADAIRAIAAYALGRDS